MVEASALFPLPGGDDGGPSAVAADEARVYLAWSGAVHGHPLVAVDPDGRVLWSHRESGKCGVRAVAAGGLVGSPARPAVPRSLF